jgi:hypothetical protein
MPGRCRDGRDRAPNFDRSRDTDVNRKPLQISTWASAWKALHGQAIEFASCAAAEGS